MQNSLMSEVSKQLYAQSLDRLNLSMIEYLPVSGLNQEKAKYFAFSDCDKFMLSLKWRDTSNEEVPHQARLELVLWGPSNFHMMEPSGDFYFPISTYREDWMDFYAQALHEARRLVVILLSPANLEPKVRKYLGEADKLQALLLA